MIWYSTVGWLIFWVGLITAIILFSNYKKLYPVFYLASICLYIFSISFMMNLFDFSKNGVLITLVFSAILFMALGYYFSRVFVNHEN